MNKTPWGGLCVGMCVCVCVCVGGGGGGGACRLRRLGLFWGI